MKVGERWFDGRAKMKGERPPALESPVIKRLVNVLLSLARATPFHARNEQCHTRVISETTCDSSACDESKVKQSPSAIQMQSRSKGGADRGVTPMRVAARATT